jgi:nitrite reductase/ring-hydroxylating ferredoxin subunit
MQRIANVADIPAEGLRFSYREGPFDDEGILLALGGGEVRAFKNECRHLAVPLDDRDPGQLWDPDRRHLVCTSHGARYRPGDGLCVDGPCKGSHLKPLPIEVRNGEIFLDTSKLGGFFDV